MPGRNRGAPPEYHGILIESIGAIAAGRHLIDHQMMLVEIDGPLSMPSADSERADEVMGSVGVVWKRKAR